MKTATTRSTDPAKPSFTYVIVHGAWGGGWAFKEVDHLLTADGNTVYRPTLTGQGERVHLSTPDIDLNTHITDIVNVILYENLHNIVLVGHSYGGMVITGVADRVPDRIAHIVYVDAFLPEAGESANTMHRPGPATKAFHPETNGYLIPEWVKPNTPLPHDVPMPAKTFSQPISLTNQSIASKIPTTYILTVDPGKRPEEDTFYYSYQRAQSRGYRTLIMEGDHNVQWSHPKELVRLLEEAPLKD